MEVNVKLKNITSDDVNNASFLNFLSLISDSKEIIKQKRKKFASSLANIKKTAVSRAKRDAFNEAKKDYLENFLSSKNFYNEAVLLANKDCLDLSLNIAKEIIDNEIKLDKSIFTKKINNELRNLRERNDVKIICNKDIAPFLEKDFKNIKIEVDEYLQEDKVYLSSCGGKIEIDLQNELDYVASILKKELLNNANK